MSEGEQGVDILRWRLPNESTERFRERRLASASVAFVQNVATGVIRALGERLRGVDNRLRDIEARLSSAEQGNAEAISTCALQAQRVKVLEERPTLKHVGIWAEGMTYKENNLVQYGGSCWLAKRQTSVRPGLPDSGWQLTAKRGGNGRDAQ